MAEEDISIGSTIGRWQVVGIRFVKGGKAYWDCRCSCPKATERPVREYLLKKKTSRSCGCLLSELTTQRETTHGKAYSRVYRIWNGMKGRCLNPNLKAYGRYGGAGIGIDDPRWFKFENFYADMGDPPTDQHTLDRILNHQGYSKLNCRWATRKEQQRNRTINHFLTLNGEPKTIGEWSEILNLPDTTIHSRLSAGYSDEDALKTKTLARQNLIPFEDEIKTLAEWAILKNIPYEALRQRISYLGWTIERALTTPPGRSGPTPKHRKNAQPHDDQSTLQSVEE